MTMALCAAGLPMSAMHDAGVLLSAILYEAEFFLTTPFLLLESDWLPKLLQSDPQLVMLITDRSPSAFKIRSLSDAQSMTFNSYMNKAERKRRVYPLEQESWK